MTVRWGDMTQMVAYLNLLMHRHELGLLNLTLASNPELGVDKKMLQEMKQVSVRHAEGGQSYFSNGGLAKATS
jgi:hypothetical protein